MALSVKRFINDLNCPEPPEQVSVMYHPTSPDVLCDGGGTPTAIFANNGSLQTIVNNSETPYAAGADTCTEGMDVVFVVDYTSSMSNAIEGVKTGVNGIVSTINSSSGGNYRLGLVLFDGGELNYSSSNFYTSLPAAQKINGNGILVTCAEKMSSIGNSISFTQALNSINTADMPIGDSNPTGIEAIHEIVNNDFAGFFRSGVQKLIVLITDGTYSNWTSNPTTAQVSDDLDFIGAQVLYQTSDSFGGFTHNRWSGLLDTQPAGSATYLLNYNSNSWTTNLNSSISSLCSGTYLYSCDVIATGWYMASAASANRANYWNGTAWTTQNLCNYTVKVNLAKGAGQSASWDIKPIPSDHPNYFDANTFIFTGDYSTSNSYGADGVLTWEIEAATDYSISNISAVGHSTQSGTSTNFKSFTDNGVGSSNINPDLAQHEFQIAGPMTQDAEFTIVLSAKLDNVGYSMKVIVIGDEPDGLDAGGVAQSPSGAIAITGTNPEAFWLNAASAYPTKTGAQLYTFSGTVGSSHSFGLDLNPYPTDYSIDVTSYIDTYSSTAAQNAIGPNIVVNDSSVSGTFAMPSGGGVAEIFLDGQVNQPDYNFVLTVTDSITGVSVISGDQTQTYTGYTGQTFNWHADLTAGANIASYTIDYSENSVSPSTYVSIGSGAGAGEVYGVVSMPSGGDSATVTVAGSSVPSTYSMEITFTDDFTSDETYGEPITVTGTAGQTINTVKTLTSTDANTSYVIDKITSNNAAVTVTKSGTTLTVKTVMPSGGGTATVAVEGSQTLNTYLYTVSLGDAVPNASIVGANAEGVKILTATLAVGAQHTFTEAISLSSGYYYTSGPTSSSNNATAVASVNAAGSISITVTGGSSNRIAEVEIRGNTAIIQRTLTVKYRDSQLNLEASVTSGSGAGYTTYNQDSFTGAPGATGTKTLYYMPVSGYVSASINSIASTNTNLAGGTPSIGSNAGQSWTLDYTIPNSNSNATVTITGSSVAATAATAATTLRTEATAAPTDATSATTKATAATTLATAATTLATAATTLRTEPTLEPTLATIGTKATNATNATEEPLYWFANGTLCEGGPSRKFRSSSRFFQGSSYTTNWDDQVVLITTNPYQATVEEWFNYSIMGSGICEGGGDGGIGDNDPEDPRGPR